MKNKKYSMFKFGKQCYYLGKDKDGTNYFLEAASWDCDWYWGGGYVETYTNNNNPIRSADINSHNHFDTMFLSGRKRGRDAFKEFFVETPFTDKEIWKICELMSAFYIKSENEYKRINQNVIPAIMSELYKILEVE